MNHQKPTCYCGAAMVRRFTSKFTKADGSAQEFFGCSRYRRDIDDMEAA